MSLSSEVSSPSGCQVTNRTNTIVLWIRNWRRLLRRHWADGARDVTHQTSWAAILKLWRKQYRLFKL